MAIKITFEAETSQKMQELIFEYLDSFAGTPFGHLNAERSNAENSPRESEPEPIATLEKKPRRKPKSRIPPVSETDGQASPEIVPAQVSEPEAESPLDTPVASQPESSFESETEGQAKPLSRSDLVDKLQHLVKKRSIIVGREILKQLGVDRVSQIPDDKLGEFDRLLDLALSTQAK